MKPEERISVELLNRYAYEYYTKTPIFVSDSEYGRLYRERWTIAHPDEILPESPVTVVVLKGLPNTSNYSLQDAFRVKN